MSRRGHFSVASPNDSSSESAGKPLRRVRYRVAASLDGYIAGPNGEIDWIVADPSVDFGALYGEFDTVLLGRRTYELTLQPGAPPWPVGWRIYVSSRTLAPRTRLRLAKSSSSPSGIVNLRYGVQHAPRLGQ